MSLRSAWRASSPFLSGALSLSLVLTLILPARAALAQDPADPLQAAAVNAVEHWIGTGVVEGTAEYAYVAPGGEWFEPQIAVGSSVTSYDLYVEANGSITGLLKVRWQGATTIQPEAQANCLPAVAENSYHGYNCTISQAPSSGSFAMLVTGTRTYEQGGVKFDLDTTDNQTRVWRTMTGIQFDPNGGWTWTHRSPALVSLFLPPSMGMGFEGIPVPSYGNVLVEYAWHLDFVSDQNPHDKKRIDFAIRLFEVGPAPTLAFDVELLERSVFMDAVSVPDALTANASWQTVEGGRTNWRLPGGSESTPLSRETVVQKSVDVGTIGVGPHPVAVQAVDSLNRATQEELTRVIVAAYFMRCPNYTATKQDKVVTYKCEVKVPKDEPFEARIDHVPGFVPYFGGGPLGLGRVQFSAALELKSSGEGSVAGDASLLFSAMGGDSGGKIVIKGDLLLKPDGVYFTGGSLSVQVIVKAKRTEGLLKAIPALSGALGVVRRLAPKVADYLENTAKVTLELGGFVGPTFPLVRDPNPAVGWKFGQTTVDAGVDFSVDVALNLFEEVLEAKAKVGGGVTVLFNVPPKPTFLKQLELKFTASFTGVVLEWEKTVENAWVFAFPSGASAGDLTVDDLATAAIAEGPVFSRTTDWMLRDRSYLTQPGYSQWVGPTADNVSVRGDLVHRTSPQGDLAFADYGSYQQWLLWSYERPDNAGAGINPTNSDEIAFANLGSAAAQRPPSGYTLMTTDDRSDSDPQIAFVSTLPMVVWERMDTNAPGDFPAAPEAYLSHLQVAASTFAWNATNPTLTPVQISASGSLNHRPQVVDRAYNVEQFLAVWVNNPANMLMGDAAHPDRFMYALYNRATGAWTPAQAIIGTVPGIQSFDIGSWRDTINWPTILGTALVFTADADGNPATPNDTEIYYSEYLTPQNEPSAGWSPITRLTNNSVDERDVQIVFTGEAQDGMEMVLVWRAGNTLMEQRGTAAARWSGTPRAIATVPAQAGPIQLAAMAWPTQLAVGWVQPEGFASVRLLDDATAWTNPRLVRTAPRVPSRLTMAFAYDPDPDVGKGPVYFAQMETSALITRTLGGIQYPNFPVVAQRDLVALPDPTRDAAPTIVAGSVQALAGTPRRVAATLVNGGDEDASGYEVQLVARVAITNPVDTILAQQAVGIANNAQVPVTLTVPAVPAEAMLTLELVDTEQCYGSCLIDAVPLPADAVAAWGGPTAYTPQTIFAHLRVGQQGPLAHAATLDVRVRKGRAGPVVSTVAARLPMAPGATVDVSAPISAALLGPGTHLLEWEIVSDGRVSDPNPENNVNTSLAIVAPDLFVDPYFTLLDGGTTVRARVENLGNFQSAATTLEVWSDMPGTTGAAKLGSVAVPPLDPGAHADLAVQVAAAADAASAGASAARYLLLDPANLVAEIDENTNVIGIKGTATAEPPATQFRILLPIVGK